MRIDERSPSPKANLKIESHTFEFIPETERHGKPASQFNIWFAANMQIVAIVTGALLVFIGLPLPWAILANLIGVGIGTIFMALHAAQGPVLGTPQMIQSRAQFGYYGVILPIIIVLLMYVGFTTSNNILGGQAVNGLAPDVPLNASIIAIAVVSTVIAIVGYRLIHAVERWIAVITGVGFAYLTVMLFVRHDIGAVWHAGHLPVGMFVLGITIGATWTITYAPLVADYSRYLPRETSSRHTFWWAYAGCAIASFWMLGFGSVAGAVATKGFEGGTVGFLVDLAPSGVHWLFYIIIILGIIAANVLEIYGGFMAWSVISTSSKRVQLNQRTRTASAIGMGLIATVLAVLGHGSFVDNFENFILFLSYFVIPWTGVNLTDFYLVRKGEYHIHEVFKPNGMYGRFTWQAIAAYLVAVCIEIPFMSTTFYTGPFVKQLGGADISWLLGLIFAGGLYAVFMHVSPPAHDRPILEVDNDVEVSVE